MNPGKMGNTKGLVGYQRWNHVFEVGSSTVQAVIARNIAGSQSSERVYDPMYESSP